MTHDVEYDEYLLLMTIHHYESGENETALNTA